MSDPILYVYPGKNDLPSPSPPCSKVLLALSYSGLKHEVKHVPGDPRGVSPTGRLPAFKVGGDVLSDSVDILDRVEQLNPPKRISPEDPKQRIHDRLWERFANEHFYWRMVYLRWVVPENSKRTCDAFFRSMPFIARLIVPGIARREAQGRAKGQGIAGFDLDRIRRDVVEALDAWEVGLGDGPFLEGRSEPSRADFAAAGHLPQLPYLGLTPWAGAELKKRPKLVDYATRVYEACGMPTPSCMTS